MTLIRIKANRTLDIVRYGGWPKISTQEITRLLKITGDLKMKCPPIQLDDERSIRLENLLLANPGLPSSILAKKACIEHRTAQRILSLLAQDQRAHRIGTSSSSVWRPGVRPIVEDVPREYIQAASIWQVGYRCHVSMGGA